jgi:hypothetical protein
MRKYFRVIKNRKWVFATQEGKELRRHTATKIVRHIKVQGSRSPFDGDWAYWATRLGRNPLVSPRRARLLREQKANVAPASFSFDTRTYWKSIMWMETIRTTRGTTSCSSTDTAMTKSPHKCYVPMTRVQ